MKPTGDFPLRWLRGNHPPGDLHFVPSFRESTLHEFHQAAIVAMVSRMSTLESTNLSLRGVREREGDMRVQVISWCWCWLMNLMKLTLIGQVLLRPFFWKNITFKKMLQKIGYVVYLPSWLVHADESSHGDFGQVMVRSWELIFRTGHRWSLLARGNI